MSGRLMLLAAGLTIILGCAFRDKTAPLVEVVEPARNAVVAAAETRVTVAATDDKHLSWVAVYVDTLMLDSSGGGISDTFRCTWDATGERPGSTHRIVARAQDRWGNSADDTCVVVIAGGAGPTTHSSDITAGEVWWPSGNPHVVATSINVCQGARLTILPGCVVRFDDGAGLTVGWGSAGEVSAVGTSDSVIVFQSNSATPGPGSWYGVRCYEGTRRGSVFSHCRFEHAGEAGGAAFSLLMGAIVRMDHTTITGSAGAGIDYTFQGHCVDFESNTVTGCASYPVRVPPEGVRFLKPGNSLTGNGRACVPVGSGGLAGSGTWFNLGMPYIVEEGATIQVGGSAAPVLTIEPGVVLKFRTGAGIQCGLAGSGGIVASGSSGSPVTFTSDAESPARGDWRGLAFYGRTLAGTRLSHCMVEFAGAGGAAAVRESVSSSLSLDDCVIRQSGGAGVLCVDGHLRSFSNNVVTSCAGPALRLPADGIRHIGPGNSLTGNDPGGDIVLVDGGNVVTSGNWRKLGVPYVFRASVQVAGDSAPVVVVEPGATLQFQRGAGIVIGDTATSGGLVADGTTGQIAFISAAESSQPGDWHGLSFLKQAIDTMCRLRNCQFSYGGGDNKGNIVITDAIPEVTGCLISFSKAWGIYLNGTEYPDPDTLEAANTFASNDSGSVRRP